MNHQVHHHWYVQNHEHDFENNVSSMSNTSGSFNRFYIKASNSEIPIESNTHLLVCGEDGIVATVADVSGSKVLLLKTNLVAGSNVTLATDPVTNAITISATGGGGSGSGTINTGVQYRLAYYPSTGTAVDDLANATYNPTAHSGRGLLTARGHIVLGGPSEATGDYSLAFGNRASTLNQEYVMAHASGIFDSDDSAGSAQTAQHVQRVLSTDANGNILTSDGTGSVDVAGSDVNVVQIPTNSTVHFHAMIVARNESVANQSAAFILEGCIDNQAGITNMVGFPMMQVIARDVGSWTCKASADNTNNCLVLSVRGTNSNKIRWLAFVRTTIVSNK